MGDTLTDIKNYIKENHKERIGMRDVSEKFDVSIAQIISWVNQGELDLKRDVEFNFKCRKCGKELFEGNYCEKCKKGLVRDISNSFEGKAQSTADKSSYNKDNPKMRFITK